MDGPTATGSMAPCMPRAQSTARSASSSDPLVDGGGSGAPASATGGDCLTRGADLSINGAVWAEDRCQSGARPLLVTECHIAPSRVHDLHLRCMRLVQIYLAIGRDHVNHAVSFIHTCCGLGRYLEPQFDSSCKDRSGRRRSDCSSSVADMGKRIQKCQPRIVCRRSYPV